MTEKYDWPILDEMPEGWRIDKTVGSPVAGCVFITDGKSVIHGQKRALLRQVKKIPKPVQYAPLKAEEVKDVVEASPEAVNRIARERMKLKLLADIRVDLEICAIEGWCKKTYIRELKHLIDSINAN